MHRHPVRRDEFADPLRAGGHVQAAVGVVGDRDARAGQYVAQPPRFRRAYPHPRVRVPVDERGHAGVREEPAAADDDEVVDGQRRLAHQMAGHEDGAPLCRLVPHEVTDPQDAFRVEPVDRLVEHQDGGVAEQRRGDSQPLTHAQGERPGPSARGAPQAGQLDHLTDALWWDPVASGQTPQMVQRGPAGVHRLGVEQRAHRTQRVVQPLVGHAPDAYLAGRRPVQAQHHAHRGGLPGAVGAQESGHPAGPYLEGEPLHSGRSPVALGQVGNFDHADDGPRRTAPAASGPGLTVLPPPVGGGRPPSVAARQAGGGADATDRGRRWRRVRLDRVERC